MSGTNVFLKLEPSPFKLFDLRQISRDILLDDASQIVQVTYVFLHTGNGIPDRHRKSHEGRLVFAYRFLITTQAKRNLSSRSGIGGVLSAT